MTTWRSQRLTTKELAIPLFLIVGSPCLGWVKGKPNIILLLVDDLHVESLSKKAYES